MSEYGILSKHIYSANQTFNNAGSFCKCSFAREINNSKQFHLICTCGEESTDSMEWRWDKKSAHQETQICKENVLIQFHPTYSQGTSVVRGNNVLKQKQHHYWEMKIITCLSGTDIMLGIGTEKVDLLSHQYKFSSFLGIDDQSYGYSYRGLIQHNGILKYYGKKYGQGCIIGIHLDLLRGNLEYYLNRRTQGKAFRKIPINDSVNYFPMASSTSAKSSIKLINSTSFDETLQFLCMKTVSKHHNLVKEMEKVPGLRHLSKKFWFLQTKDQTKYGEFEQNNLLLEDAIVCGFKNKKIRKIEDKEVEEDYDDDDDEEIYKDITRNIYAGMQKIIHVEYECSSDDDSDINQFFCDH